MPLRQSWKLCFCETCVEEGGLLPTGEPAGVKIHTQFWDIHRLQTSPEPRPASVVQDLSLSDLRTNFIHDMNDLTEEFSFITVESDIERRERSSRATKAKKTLSLLEADFFKCLRQSQVPYDRGAFHLLRHSTAAIREHLEKITYSTPTLDDQKTQLKEQLNSLASVLDTALEQDPIALPVEYKCDRYYSAPINSTSPMAQLCLLLPVISSLIMGLSRQAASFILRVIGLILQESFEADQALSTINKTVLRDVPKDIRTALDRFDLSGEMTTYAICPCCSYSYKPSAIDNSYPSHCINQILSLSEECGEALLALQLVNGIRTVRPIKTFIFHEFKDWLGRMLSRKEIKEYMDKACDEEMEAIRMGWVPDVVGNVFQGSYVRSFSFPYPSERLFIDRRDECRCIFSLNADFFNVNANTERGAKTSTGLIVMACLNLPVAVRYRPENMYLCGIIPGPTEPELTNTNHYMRPLIDDLLESWVRGVKFSRTWSSPEGRIVHCALGPVVCDLPAAQKFAGFAGFAGHNSRWFCSFCLCQGRTEYGRTDYDSWIQRDLEATRTQAEAWRDAINSHSRDKIFEQSGVRYSELWRLPYWNPNLQLTVDAMHNLLEGLVQKWFRFDLGLTTKDAEKVDGQVRHQLAFQYSFSNASSDLLLNKMEKNQVRLIQNDLMSPVSHLSKTELERKLKARHLSPLRYVSNDISGGAALADQSQKNDCIAKLVEWRLNQPHEPEALVTYETSSLLHFIRTVIKHTDTPSWLSTVPSEFGDARQGTLKADEWRVMATVYLPISLVLSWGNPPPHDNTGVKRFEALKLSMHLVTAVRLACTRTISLTQIECYMKHMTSFLSDISGVVPGAHPVCNHHMALHIPGFLRLWGPVHSWWCFPFERLIQKLQQIPTNDHLEAGQVESSISTRYIREANLHGWLSQKTNPAVIQECFSIFQFLFPMKQKGGMGIGELGDEIAGPELSTGKLKQLPADLTSFKSLPNRSRFLARTRLSSGVVVSCSDIHSGNSLVLYYPGGDSSLPAIPGRIKYILQNASVLLGIQRYLPLLVPEEDLFRFYSYFPAKMYRNRVSDMELIELSWIKCHFAIYIIQENIVMVSLSRDDAL